MPTNETLSQEMIRAIQFLGQQTAETFQLRRLAGPNQLWLRSHLMAQLMDRKVRNSECGVNALTEAFYAAAGISMALCAARQADEFVKWCKAQLDKDNERFLNALGYAKGQNA